MTDWPFRLVPGATLPHWETLQVAFQVTPFMLVSFVRLAAREVLAPAGTEVAPPAETLTVMAGVGGLLLPQPVRKGIDRNARRDRRTTHVARLMALSMRLARGRDDGFPQKRFRDYRNDRVLLCFYFPVLFRRNVYATGAPSQQCQPETEREERMDGLLGRDFVLEGGACQGKSDEMSAKHKNWHGPSK